MAKSGRKRKKAEKSKIQLKKGKKSLRLPKGLNETDSRVTTKKIQVANQLGQSEPTGEPVSKKNISLKDLLNKLNSQSGSIRIDGLDGLAEILKGEHSVALLESSLSLMIHKLSPLTNDNEGKVRKLAITVLGQVIRQVRSSLTCLKSSRFNKIFLFYSDQCIRSFSILSNFKCSPLLWTLAY